MAVRRCPDHGFFAGDACPDCGARGARVLSPERRERLSRFLGGLPRHLPGDHGVALDAAGWAAWDAVVRAATRQYDWADGEAVAGRPQKPRFLTGCTRASLL